MAMVIEVDGTERELKELSYPALKEAIGGWLETAHTCDGRFLVLDEEGRLKGLALNRRATELFEGKGYDYIVGTVVVLTKRELEISLNAGFPIP